MSTSDKTSGWQDSVVVSSAPESPTHEPVIPISALAAQLDKLTAVVGEIKTRLDDPGRRLGEFVVPSRPLPAPPFSTVTAWTPPVTTMVPHTSVIPSFVPPVTSQHTAGFHVPQTLAAHQPQTFAIPEYTNVPYRGPPQSQPWVQERVFQRPPERPPVSRPQMISPTSCWAPPGPGPRPQFGNSGFENHSSRGRMDPPRFDALILITGCGAFNTTSTILGCPT